jgi:spoIIIJ-associated protein
MAAKPITVAKKKLEDLLAKLGAEAKVTVASEDPPQLNIETDRAGSLIGARGEGIRSLQHLLRVFMVRDGQELPVVVDIDGYRVKREQQLVDMAKRKAETVRTSGRLAVLSPMSSYERRVVHLTLADEDGVVTESLGEGQNRRVMIKKVE